MTSIINNKARWFKQNMPAYKNKSQGIKQNTKGIIVSLEIEGLEFRTEKSERMVSPEMSWCWL